MRVTLPTPQPPGFVNENHREDQHPHILRHADHQQRQTKRERETDRADIVHKNKQKKSKKNKTNQKNG